MTHREPPNTDAIRLAEAALRRREDLAGAGQSIMQSYGLDERTARRLHAYEVERRRRESAQ